MMQGYFHIYEKIKYFFLTGRKKPDKEETKLLVGLKQIPSGDGLLYHIIRSGKYE